MVERLTSEPERPSSVFLRLGLVPHEARSILQLTGSVPRGPVISSTVCTVLNIRFDSDLPPTTTTDSLKKAGLMFKRLAGINPQEHSFTLAQDYFQTVGLLLQEKASPKKRYQTLLAFFKEAGMFSSCDLTETEYITKCLSEAGISIDPQEVEEYAQSLPSDFHHPYLGRIFAHGVEIMDQSPSNHPSDPHLQQLVADSLGVVTADYHDIKARKIATPVRNLERRKSLLLIDYLAEVDKLVEKFSQGNKRKPVILVIGPGKGEELIHFSRKGYCMVVVDMQPNDLLVKMFEDNFLLNTSEILTADSCPFSEYVAKYTKRSDYPQGSLLLMGGVDLDRSTVSLPTNSVDICCSSYTLHHSKNLPHWLNQIRRVTRPLSGDDRRAIVLFDGLPTTEHYQRQFLPIIALTGNFTTGWDGTVSHTNSIPPEVWPLIFKNTFGSHHPWKAEIARKGIQTPLGTIIIASQVKLTAY